MSIEKNKNQINENLKITETKTDKPKRVMSDAQKEALKRGREKAHERMRNLKHEKEQLQQIQTPIKSVDEEEEVKEIMPELVVHNQDGEGSCKT